ncbi:MAG: hypothetical protein GXP38_14620 [Chloroflexi bacterium]|nr:hypothetical protein [Chloroflexota bacterium]
MNRRFSQHLLVVIAIIGLVGGWLLWQRPAQALDRPALKTALLATVRIAVPLAGEEDSYSTGSGTVLSADGLILTNFHVVGDIDKGNLYNDDGLVFIAVNPPDLRSEPVWKYRASVIKSSQQLDLAVLRIDGLLAEDETQLPQNLGLIPVPLGTSDDLLIGDEINTFGFPGIGRGSVTFTRGIVAGFLDEDRDGVLDWIKTDADIARGNSGGLATDAQGRMIGIPSAGIADVETASSISLIRPVDLALPLIRAAQNQATTTEVDKDTKPSTLSPVAPKVKSVQFAAAIDRSGNAIDPDSRFDVGVKAIYAVFDYENFENDAEFVFRWRREGLDIASNHFRWQEGTSGSDWVNIYARQALQPGYYELELLLGGESVYRGGFIIGDRIQTPSGSFGPITFARDIDDASQPVGADVIFSDVDTIYAFFDVYNVAKGVSWRRRWYVDDELALDTERIWDDASAEDWWISITADGGLPPGRYRLELLIEEQIVQQATFSIVEPSWNKGAEAVMVIGTISDADRKSRKIADASVFVLNPEITVAEFLAKPDQALVYAFATSDQEGSYRLDKFLTPGEQYGIVVYHKDYQIVSADAYSIAADATSPWRIDVTMKRK